MKENKTLNVKTVYKIYGKSGAYIYITNSALSSLGITPAIIPTINMKDILNEKAIYHLHFPEELYRNSKYLIFFSLWTSIKILLLKIRGSKFVWTVHDIYPHDPVRVPYLDRLFRRFLIEFMDLIIVHNTYTLNQMIMLGANRQKLKKIYHPNYSGYYTSIPTKNYARKLLGIDVALKVFLFFGRIRPYKGLYILIQAFKNLPPDNILLLAGVPVGNDWNIKKNKKNLLKLLKNHKNILPHLRWIEDAELPIFFSAADYVILPFKQVTTSGSLILAQSFGKPVIAPRIDSIPEYLSNKTGILYSPDKQNALIEAIKLIQNKDLNIMQRETIRLVAKYSPTTVGKQLKEIYLSLLEDS